MSCRHPTHPSSGRQMIIISNGFSKFHLAVAAEEAHRRGLLARLITGAYPTPTVERALTTIGLAQHPKIARLLRRDQDIPRSAITPLFLAEFFYQPAMALRAWKATRAISHWLDAFSFRLYGWLAVGVIRRIREAQIYHYRAGFGHRSARLARKKGMVLLCDHSIVHPALQEYLVAHDGRFPRRKSMAASRILREIQADIEQADHVLVNSDFVRQTFLHEGWNPSRIHVIYWGVDNQFLDALPRRDYTAQRLCSGPLRLMFSGAFCRRKGAEILISALEKLSDLDWRLDLAGSVDDDIREHHRDFFSNPRVAELGTRSRAELARAMSTAEIFLFPSLAEGSARVVFEALAAGCYVVTTPNSGSIVEDGVHGAVVPPGDSDALADAVRRARASRHDLSRIGEANAHMMRSRYRQSDYGDALAQLYRCLAPLIETATSLSK